MWTEQQRALLRGMGLRVWCPPLGGADDRLEPVGASPADAAPTAAPEQAAGLQAVAAPAAQLRPAASTIASAAASVAPVAVVPARAPAAVTAGVPAGAGVDTTAVATLDWPALRAAVAACRACSLCDSRTQTVFGTGDEQAHWMVVGEAPGEQEDQRGEPFVGAAGQLLDAMLRALALTRATDGDAPPAQRVYIANTLKCRPPRNRNPEPAEMARCEPFLVRQIELLRPRIILAMGRFAVQALLRSSEPIGRLRGQVHRYQGVPLVVTYHPAYLLRQPQDKARAWDDLCLAAEVVAAAEPATDRPAGQALG
jgi:DNA polymerase